MESMDCDLDDGKLTTDATETKPRGTGQLSIQRCVQTLEHACQCRDAKCGVPYCQRMMKLFVQHVSACNRNTNGGCFICGQIESLCCYHARHCQETKCPMPFCSNIKQNIKQQIQEQAELITQRMAMTTLNSREATSVTPTGSAITAAMENAQPSPSAVLPGCHNGLAVATPWHTA